ncbi:hypothetical protein [Streptomyces viridochromogenes]|uniref:hypothetical protein n=1 Tax=Streptomyces viridochromogenes TaxID=1938 RepID=UPI0002FF886D|nr:hypothetical protein [Streptomyces viridochromogenes]
MDVRGRTIRQASVTPPPTGGYRPADRRSLVPTGLRRERDGVFASHSAGVDPPVGMTPAAGAFVLFLLRPEVAEALVHALVH